MYRNSCSCEDSVIWTSRKMAPKRITGHVVLIRVFIGRDIFSATESPMSGTYDKVLMKFKEKFGHRTRCIRGFSKTSAPTHHFGIQEIEQSKTNTTVPNLRILHKWS